MNMPATLLSSVNNKYLLRRIFLLLSITSFSTLATAEKISDAVSEAAAVSGTWTSVRAMTYPRLSIQAAPLAQNQILVVGGVYQSGITQSMARHQASSNQWTNLGPPHSLLRHTVTPLSSIYGNVLIAGGTTENGRLSTSYVYSYADGGWFTSGAMRFKRDQHTATLLQDGRVLVAGGWGTATLMNTAELYHPNSSTIGVWTQTGSMKEARITHTATLLSNGKVLVAGGFDHRSYLNTVELYDPHTSTWTQAGTMNTARGDHTATLLSNGKILVTGGYGNSPRVSNTAELYDPDSDTWTQIGMMNSHRTQHTATPLPDGRVLVAGGLNNSTEVLKTAELYDPSNGLWTSTESMHEARLQHAAVLRQDGKVFIVGGLGDVSGANILATAEVYTP